jgi:predicted heme/steroid binding protein
MADINSGMRRRQARAKDGDEAAAAGVASDEHEQSGDKSDTTGKPSIPKIQRSSCKRRCCKYGMLIVLVSTMLFGLAFALVPSVQISVRLWLMRFFRDVSRARARRNLHGEGSIIPYLMGTDTVMEVMDDGEDGVWLTEDELKDFDGRDENTPLYLSIKNRIYDVTAGGDFYGKGRSYHHFVGRDATRAFVTGCTEGSCLVSSVAGLDSLWLAEIDRWVELYE